MDQILSADPGRITEAAHMCHISGLLRCSGRVAAETAALRVRTVSAVDRMKNGLGICAQGAASFRFPTVSALSVMQEHGDAVETCNTPGALLFLSLFFFLFALDAGFHVIE